MLQVKFIIEDIKSVVRLLHQVYSIKKEPTVFWGASLFLKSILKLITHNPYILGIIDNDKNKVGNVFCNRYKVFTPEALNELCPKNVIYAIKNNSETHYPKLKNFLAEEHPNINLLPNIFKPKFEIIGIFDYRKRILNELAQNPNKKSRLFIDTGIVSLINIQTVIKTLENDFDNYILIYSEYLTDEFKNYCAKIIAPSLFKQIHFIDAYSSKNGCLGLNNSEFIQKFDSIYTSSQPQFKIWEHHKNINLVEEGISSYIKFDEINYKGVKDIYLSNYFKKNFYVTPYEYQNLKLLDKEAVKQTIKDIRTRLKIDFSYLATKNQVLLLSQYLYNDFYSEEALLDFYKKHIDKLLNSGYSVLFKSHPRFKDTTITRLADLYANDSRFKVFPEDVKYPVELVIEDIIPVAIATSMSGGAFNCAHLFDIPCYGFGANIAKRLHPSNSVKLYADFFLDNIPHIKDLYSNEECI